MDGFNLSSFDGPNKNSVGSYANILNTTQPYDLHTAMAPHPVSSDQLWEPLLDDIDVLRRATPLIAATSDNHYFIVPIKGQISLGTGDGAERWGWQMRPKPNPLSRMEGNQHLGCAEGINWPLGNPNLFSSEYRASRFYIKRCISLLRGLNNPTDSCFTALAISKHMFKHKRFTFINRPFQDFDWLICTPIEIHHTFALGCLRYIY